VRQRVPQNLAVITLALVGVVLAASCAADPRTAAYPDRSHCTVALSVPDMSCSAVCPDRVRAALASVEGVDEIDVDFEGRRVALRGRWPACGSRGYARMLDRLEQAGYVASIDSEY
jgi:copper chaperone CopZ